MRDDSECTRGVSDRRAPDAQGASDGLRPVTVRVCRGGLVERPVVLCRRACAVAVGGNGRVQTASDTWLTPEHRTLGVERPVAPYERPVPSCFAQ